jgi:hypothetical protein
VARAGLESDAPGHSYIGSHWNMDSAGSHASYAFGGMAGSMDEAGPMPQAGWHKPG